MPRVANSHCLYGQDLMDYLVEIEELGIIPKNPRCINRALASIACKGLNN